VIFDLLIRSLREFSFIIWKSMSEELSYLSLGIVVLLLDVGYSHLWCWFEPQQSQSSSRIHILYES
jgi:hypothetical protein